MPATATDGNITLRRLLNRYTPKDDVLDRVIQFYQMSTELEQLKEPRDDNRTPFAAQAKGNAVAVSFKDNCDAGDGSASAEVRQSRAQCRTFAASCKTNADRSKTKWPKDILCALEVVWDGERHPLLHYVKPVDELGKFDYDQGELFIPLRDFAVSIGCAESLELADATVAAIDGALHGEDATFDLVEQRIKSAIGPEAVLDTGRVRLSLCEKNLTLAQTYAELGKMNAAGARGNPLLAAFLEQSEFDGRLEQVFPDELISAVEMDEPQRAAVAHALGNRVSVVVGPPGCGKTQLLLNLIANALVRGKKVLVASKNNKAVDNVCERFKQFDEDGCFLRFGPKSHVRDFTLPALRGLLNRAQSQDYDDAEYVAAADEFRKAVAAARAKAGLEAELEKHRSAAAADENAVASLGGEIAAAKKELDDIREGCFAEAKGVLRAEFQNQREAAKALGERVAGLEKKIVAERERHANELDAFREKHGDEAAQEALDGDTLSGAIAKLQVLGVDIEYRIGGLRGLFVRRATIAKLAIDAVSELSGKVQDFLRGVDARRSIGDFASRRDVVRFCGRLRGALAAILQYRSDVEKLQKASGRTVAKLEADLEAARAEKAKADARVAETRELLSDENGFLAWALREYGDELEGRQATTKANLAGLEESLAKKRQHLEAERASVAKTEATLQSHAELAARVSGIGFGRRFVALTLAHNLHQPGAARAIAGYSSFLPIDPKEMAFAVEPAGRFLDAVRLDSVTSLSVRNAFPLANNLFDMLVIDEASQCDVASALPLILRAKQLVVIGDPMQLRHISKVDDAEEQAVKSHLGLAGLPHLKYAAASLWDFTRAWLPKCGDDAPCVLRNHYRCHSDIVGYSNEMFYRDIGGLEVCTPERPDGPEGGILWQDVRGRQQSDAKNINEAEAQKAVELAVKCLQKYPGCTIGIVTPFAAQAERINAIVPAGIKNGVVVDTVHKFQGDEKDVMIYSLVVTDNSPDGKIGWIDRKCPNLVNVAVTRARRLLVVVGNRSYIKTHSQTNQPLGHLELYVGTLEKLRNAPTHFTPAGLRGAPPARANPTPHQDKGEHRAMGIFA